MISTAFKKSKTGMLKLMPVFFNVDKNNLQIDIENGTIKEVKIFFSLY